VALADILKRIDADAKGESDAIIAEAEREAEEMLAEAKKRAAAHSEQMLARARDEADNEASTRLAAARLDARDRMLGVKQDLVERVLKDIVSRIEGLPDDEYAALIAREVADIARGDERLLVGEADHSRLSKSLPKALKEAGVKVEVGDSTKEIKHGVMLQGDRVRADVSPQALVDANRDRLTSLVADALFGNGEEPAGKDESAGSGGEG